MAPMFLDCKRALAESWNAIAEIDGLVLGDPRIHRRLPEQMLPNTNNQFIVPSVQRMLDALPDDRRMMYEEQILKANDILKQLCLEWNDTIAKRTKGAGTQIRIDSRGDLRFLDEAEAESLGKHLQAWASVNVGDFMFETDDQESKDASLDMTAHDVREMNPTKERMFDELPPWKRS